MEVTSQELNELYGEFKSRMQGDLRSNLFDFLNSLEDDADNLTVIRKFINFIVWYKGQVDRGLANEEVMIAGLYPATKQVKEVSWDKIIELLNKYEEDFHGGARREAEYVPSSEDLVDEEGRE